MTIFEITNKVKLITDNISCTQGIDYDYSSLGIKLFFIIPIVLILINLIIIKKSKNETSRILFVFQKSPKAIIELIIPAFITIFTIVMMIYLKFV